MLLAGVAYDFVLVGKVSLLLVRENARMMSSSTKSDENAVPVDPRGSRESLLCSVRLSIVYLATLISSAAWVGLRDCAKCTLERGPRVKKCVKVHAAYGVRMRARMVR